MSAQWWGFAGGLLAGFLWSLLFARMFQRWLDRRTDKKFLRMVQVRFPNGKIIESISVSSTDAEAMANVERRLRDASRSL